MDLRGIAQSKPLSLEALGFLAALRWGDFKPAAGCIYPVGWRMVYSLVGIDWLIGTTENAVRELVTRGLIWAGAATGGPIVVLAQIRAPRSEGEARTFALQVREVRQDYGSAGRGMIERAEQRLIALMERVPAEISRSYGESRGGQSETAAARAGVAPVRRGAPILKLVPAATTDRLGAGSADTDSCEEGGPCTP